jgi:hypothetical protein
MDELLEYRERHKAKYEERETERMNERIKIKKIVDTSISEIDVLCDVVSKAKKVEDISAKLQDVHTLLLENKASLPDLMEHGLRIYEEFNNNVDLYSSFASREDVVKFKEFEVLMKQTLTACNIDPEIIDIQVDMDCSKDEEIAEKLMMAMVLGTPALPARKKKPKPRSEEDIEFLGGAVEERKKKVYKKKVNS